MTSRRRLRPRWLLLPALATFTMFHAEGSSVPAGTMHAARSGHQATLLVDGRVLVTGGSDARGDAIGLAEVFDPATGQWSRAAVNLVRRLGHAAALLHDGRVLVVGGIPSSSSCEPIGSAELYDPSHDRWTMTARVPASVGNGTVAVTLQDGRVLVAGGGTGCDGISRAAALFDPKTDTWSATTAMESPARFHVATLLADGRVIVSGGARASAAGESIASLYDPTTAEWARAPEPRPLTGDVCDGYTRTYSAAFDRNSLIARATSDDCPSLTVLPAGTLLIAGGRSTTTNAALHAAQLSDLKTDEAVPTWPMQHARAGHTATRLKNGVVLIAGGRDDAMPLSSSELYVPRMPYEAWTAAMPRGWLGRQESFTYGTHVAAAFNSRNHLLVSYARSTYGTPLIEWVPRWADFATGAHWVGAPQPRPLFQLGGPYPPYREFGQDLPVFDSLRVDQHDNVWGLSAATRQVYKISPQGRVLLRFGRRPSRSRRDVLETSQPGIPRRYLDSPTDLAIDRRGNVFVADGGRTPRVIKFDSRGRFVADTGGSTSTERGLSSVPRSLAVDDSGDVYVADSGHARIQVFDNSLTPTAVYRNVGTPWALCVTHGRQQFLYSASNPELAESDRPAEIYKLELDGTILGKVVGQEPGKVILTLRHIDCREPNTAVGVGGYDGHLQRISVAR